MSILCCYCQGAIIKLLVVMTLPSFEPDTTLPSLSNAESPDVAAKQMELVIRTSGRAASLQPTRFCYPYGHESRKRPKLPSSGSIGQNAPMGDRKKAQIAEGEFDIKLKRAPIFC
jgi:hypothetical protein